jgi:hypothetical protein
MARRVGSGALFPTDEPISDHAPIGRADDIDAIAPSLMGAINDRATLDGRRRESSVGAERRESVSLADRAGAPPWWSATCRAPRGGARLCSAEADDVRAACADRRRPGQLKRRRRKHAGQKRYPTSANRRSAVSLPIPRARVSAAREVLKGTARRPPAARRPARPSAAQATPVRARAPRPAVPAACARRGGHTPVPAAPAPRLARDAR